MGLARRPKPKLDTTTTTRTNCCGIFSPLLLLILGLFLTKSSATIKPSVPPPLFISKDIHNEKSQYKTKETETECICKVVQTVIAKEARFDGDVGTPRRSTLDRFDCNAVAQTMPYHSIRLDVYTDDALLLENEESLAAGKWFVAFDCAWILRPNNDENSLNGGSSAAVVAVPPRLPRERNSQIRSLSMTEIEALFLENELGPSSRRLDSHYEEQQPLPLKAGGTGGGGVIVASRHPRRRRRLHRRLSNVGKQQSLIVIAHAPDQTNPLTIPLAEEIVYNQANAQFQACSNGALELIKKQDSVQVTLPQNISAYEESSIDAILFQLICNYYGYDLDCQITHELDLDHVRPFFFSSLGSGILAMTIFCCFALFCTILNHTTAFFLACLDSCPPTDSLFHSLWFIG